MQKVLLDSNMISYFLRGELSVVTELEKYQEYFDQITFSILTYYEIVSGLKYRDSRKLLIIFEELVLESEIIGFDQDTAKIASEIYCDLRHRGLLIPPIDIFIGATAIHHDLVLVTAKQLAQKFRKLDLLSFSKMIFPINTVPLPSLLPDRLGEKLQRLGD